LDSKELLSHAERIKATIGRSVNTGVPGTIRGTLALAGEFLRTYAGPKSEFVRSIELAQNQDQSKNAGAYAIATIDAFIEYVKHGLHQAVTPERRAQLDVVSDFLSQAQQLLETKGVHPAAPAVLVGATLEEFLRTWIENTGLTLGNRKAGLDNYSQVLREAELITKQDVKDIVAWGGIRNHAAHGEWVEVADSSRVKLMLEGVNLFMRKYSA